MNLDIEQKKIVKNLSKKYNISEDKVIDIISSPFKFIRKEIKDQDFTGIDTEEKFNRKIKNFNIPSIGKLYGSFYNFKKFIKNDKTDN